MSLASITGLPRRALAWVAAGMLIASSAMPAWTTEIFSVNTATALGDNKATSSMVIDTDGRLIAGKITCSFYITHEYTRDLQISLVAPDGKRVHFTHQGWNGFSNTGGIDPGGFGTGPEFDQRVYVDDGAVDDLEGLYKATIPAGTYQGYNEDMADFCNKSVDGTWTLEINDLWPGVDQGTLYCWSLHIDPIIQRYWTGLGNDTKLSNRDNWREGNPPVHGEGAASLVFPTTTTPVQLINDIRRLTIAKLDMGGGYTWITPRNQVTGLGPCPISFADKAIVNIHDGTAQILPMSVLHRDHNDHFDNVFNRYNRKAAAFWYSKEVVELSATLRGEAYFNIAADANLTFQGMVMDYVARRQVGNVGILVDRKTGTIIKDLEGTLALNNSSVSWDWDFDLAWPYINDGNRYTGETLIRRGILSIPHARGLGRLSYNDNSNQPQHLGAGTIVDGGTLELASSMTLLISTVREDIDAEPTLELRGLGFGGTGAIRVAENSMATLDGTVDLGYVTGSFVNEGDDQNPLNANSVGVGALQNSTLNFSVKLLAGEQLPIRIVGGVVKTDPLGGPDTLVSGGTVNWQTPVPLHFAVSERTTCNISRIPPDPTAPTKLFTPDIIPDEIGILAIVNGGRLNFDANTIAPYNETTPGGDNKVFLNYRYCETVGSLFMGGGVLQVPDNGILKVADGMVTNYASTSSRSGPSQIVGHLDLGSSPKFNVEPNDTLAEHLILSHDNDPNGINTPYQVSAPLPTQASMLCYVDEDEKKTFRTAKMITKNGLGTMVLALNSDFNGNAVVNAGGLVVSTNIVDRGGEPVGNVTVNDGFVAGRGTVATILVAKGEVAPGRPILEGDTYYQRPTSEMPLMKGTPELKVNELSSTLPIGSGTLTCDAVNFASKDAFFAVGIYNNQGDCDKLLITTNGGYVNLGSAGNSSGLRPIWRAPDTPNPNQWYVIIENQLAQLVAGNFAGLPRLDPLQTLTWICYSFDPMANPTTHIQPDPAVDLAGYTAFVNNKMTNGVSVAIRVNGVVNFSENKTVGNAPYQDAPIPTATKPVATYTVPEVDESNGAATNVSLYLSGGAGKVSFQTIDDSALAGQDFTSAAGQVPSPGTGPSVSILYNQTIRDTRSFTVKLLAPTDGLALGRPSVAKVTITDINAREDEKKSGCGMSSGFAVFFLLIAGLGRLVVLRRRRD